MFILLSRLTFLKTRLQIMMTWAAVRRRQRLCTLDEGDLVRNAQADPRTTATKRLEGGAG